MGLMMLAAGPGSTLIVQAEGHDSAQALAEIETLIERKFDEVKAPGVTGLAPLSETWMDYGSVEIDVKYVAHLARLSLSPEEEQKIGAQLGNILGYIEKLKEVDVSGVEPTAHAFPLVNVTRPDEVRPRCRTGSPPQRPRPGQRLFIVPKIVE